MGFLPDLSDTGTEDSPHGQGLRRLGIPDGVLTRGSWGSDILNELTPGEADTVLYKNRYSGFYRTELDKLLTGLGDQIPDRDRLHDQRLRRVHHPRRLLPRLPLRVLSGLHSRTHGRRPQPKQP